MQRIRCMIPQPCNPCRRPQKASSSTVLTVKSQGLLQLLPISVPLCNLVAQQKGFSTCETHPGKTPQLWKETPQRGYQYSLAGRRLACWPQIWLHPRQVSVYTHPPSTKPLGPASVYRHALDLFLATVANTRLSHARICWALNMPLNLCVQAR